MKTVRVSVIGAVPPLVVGAAPFNTELVQALRERGPVQVISWSRPYPPLLYRGSVRMEPGRCGDVDNVFVLDWGKPSTWRRAAKDIEAHGSDVAIFSWLHPVSAPPYAWLLRRLRGRVVRVVICHNVEPHERVPFGRRLTGLTLRHADIFVTHAPPQRHELAELGLSDVEVVEAFHPRLEATAAAHAPTAEQVRRVRTALGNPELLLVTFGAVRPYKGVDLALEGLARVARELDVRLVVAGRFWAGLHARLVRQAEELGVSDRVAFDDRYIPDEQSAALFAAADGVLLPYRAASQSGVVQLAFAHHRPVIATAVGGLPAAVEHGTNGILVAPQPEALAAAIERFADERDALRAGVESTIAGTGFRDYASLLLDAAGRRLGSIAGTPSAPHVTAAVSTQ